MYLELRAPSDNNGTSIAHQHSKAGLSLFKCKEPDNLHEALTLYDIKPLSSAQTLCNTMDCSLPGSSVHGIFPSKNTVLQGIFPTQGLNPNLLCLLHWQVDSLPLRHLGNYYGIRIGRIFLQDFSSIDFMKYFTILTQRLN